MRRWAALLRRVFLLAAAAGVVIFLGMVMIPVGGPPLTGVPGQTMSYEEAMTEIRRGITETPASVREDSRDLVLEHGHPTKRAFVLLHGLSNSPVQFAELGRQLFERGENVFIPRMPYHGEKDRMTEEWGKLRAQDMLDSANRAIALAHGLGQEVIVVGLSVNGTTAAWFAQNRDDLSRVVLLSPFFAPAGLPPWLVPPVERLLIRLPNMFFWWNPALKEKNPGPPQAYPRFPTRVIGETIRLGQAVLREAVGEAPRTADIVVITTASDRAVDARPIQRLVEEWRTHRPEAVRTFEFPKEEAVPHDFIDPAQPDQRVDLVYPKLLELFY